MYTLCAICVSEYIYTLIYLYAFDRGINRVIRAYIYMNVVYAVRTYCVCASIRDLNNTPRYASL